MAFDRKAFGRRIAAARKLRGMSQEDLAGKSGVNVSAITRYETGDMVPSFERATEIAGALGVTPDWLAGRGSIEEVI